MQALFDWADRLSGEVINAAIEAHRIMGPGLLQSIDERCLTRGLELRGIPFLNQKEVVIDYHLATPEEPEQRTIGVEGQHIPGGRVGGTSSDS